MQTQEFAVSHRVGDSIYGHAFRVADGLRASLHSSSSREA